MMLHASGCEVSNAMEKGDNDGIREDVQEQVMEENVEMHAASPVQHKNKNDGSKLHDSEYNEFQAQ